jgi:hypothetical protein
MRLIFPPLIVPRLIVPCLVLCLSPVLPALAQDTMLDIDLQHDLPFLNAAEVAGGKLSVEKVAADGFEADQLLFNGVPVPGMTDVSVDIQAVVPRPEFVAEDMVFVTLAGGGNGCPTLWAIVLTSAQGAKASPPFGTCSEAILNLRLTESALVAFDMAPVSDGQPWMTYTADGAMLWETVLPGPP